MLKRGRAKCLQPKLQSANVARLTISMSGLLLVWSGCGVWYVEGRSTRRSSRSSRCSRTEIAIWVIVYPLRACVLGVSERKARS